MTDRLTLAVVTAGLSEDSTTTRLGDAIAQAASNVVGNVGRHVEIETIRLRDLAHGLTDMMITHVVSEDWGHNDLQRRIDRVGALLGTMLLAGSQGGVGSSDGSGAPGSDAAQPGLRREVKDEFSDVPDFASLLAAVGS